MAEKYGKKDKEARLWFRAALILLPSVANLYFRLVDLTSKKVFVNRDIEENVCKKRTFALAGFHGTLLWVSYSFRTYGGVIMVSRSLDGNLIDRCLRKWKYFTARGSSSRDGKQALEEMVALIEQNNCSAGVAVDAPRGPAEKVKIGIVLLARETGQPVVPIASWTTRHVQFRSWDRMILPLPFSTIVTAFGKPVDVPKGLSNDEYEEIRLQIEENILEAVKLAKAKVREITQSSADVAIEPAPTQATPHQE